MKLEQLKNGNLLFNGVEYTPVEDEKERLPQRFRYRKLGCNSWEFGVCIPWNEKWSVMGFAGICSFESDPWEVLGKIIGDVEAFEWIDNDFDWEGK